MEVANTPSVLWRCCKWTLSSSEILFWFILLLMASHICHCLNGSNVDHQTSHPGGGLWCLHPSRMNVRKSCASLCATNYSYFRKSTSFTAQYIQTFWNVWIDKLNNSLNTFFIQQPCKLWIFLLLTRLRPESFHSRKWESNKGSCSSYENDTQWLDLRPLTHCPLLKTQMNK